MWNVILIRIDLGIWIEGELALINSHNPLWEDCIKYLAFWSPFAQCRALLEVAPLLLMSSHGARYHSESKYILFIGCGKLGESFHVWGPQLQIWDVSTCHIDMFLLVKPRS